MIYYEEIDLSDKTLRNKILKNFRIKSGISTLSLLMLFLEIFIYKLIIEYIHGYLPEINFIFIILASSIPFGYSLSIHQKPNVEIVLQNAFIIFIQLLITIKLLAY
jgi:hypothetical protein